MIFCQLVVMNLEDSFSLKNTVMKKENNIHNNQRNSFGIKKLNYIWESLKFCHFQITKEKLTMRVQNKCTEEGEIAIWNYQSVPLSFLVV